MANDVDVGIGIKVTGDASGIAPVEAAIKGVGESAKQVAQETGAAATQAATAAASAAQSSAAGAAASVQQSGASITAEVGGIDEAMQGLSSALTTLSPEKAKGAVTGLTQAILGLATGNTQQGIAGLSQSLFSLAQSIPLPGVGVALGIAVTAIGGFYKLLATDTGEAARSVNEFGETLDEEMTRIESWANSQLSWDNIKQANADLKLDFEAVQKTVDAARTAMGKLYDIRTTGKIAALETEASAAGAAGDTGRQAELLKKVEDEKTKAELVKLNVEQAEQTISLAGMLKRAEADVKTFENIKAEDAASKSLLEGIKAEIVKQTGNLDATVAGSKAALSVQEKLASDISNLSDSIRLFKESIALNDKIAADLKLTDSTGSPVRSGFESNRAKDQISKMEGDLASLNRFADALKNYGEAAAEEAKDAAAFKAANDARDADIKATSAKIAVAVTDLQTAAEKLTQASTGVDPAILREAQEDAARQIGAMTTLADEIAKALSGKSADIIAAGIAGGEALIKATGASSTAVGEVLTMMVQPIAAIGPGLTEAAAPVAVGAEAMGTASGAIKAAGDQVKADSDEFTAKFGTAAAGFQTALSQFGITAQALGLMGQNIAQNQLTFSQTIIRLSDGVKRALDQSSLALSQIRNGRA